MRALLDTNVVIYREAARVIRADIGVLFHWLDRLRYEKCVHPGTVEEIERHRDPEVVRAFSAKIQNYSVLRTTAADDARIAALRENDRTSNDTIDTDLLREVAAGRVDLLITEDRDIHAKAARVGLAARVFTIDSFLEKANAENPALVDYKVLAVRREYFGNIDLRDGFFDSFRQDYVGFEKWFAAKSDEIAYVCRSDTGEIVAFLYVKVEGRGENYGDIEPVFRPAKRLKIGTFKVRANGFKLGERFLKIVFDNALKAGVDQIYVTLFNHSEELQRLSAMLGEWGFQLHGHKASRSGNELVLTREFDKRADPNHPAACYPFFRLAERNFIVPIYPAYHTELFPDSILRTESPLDFVENRPNRNAIRKAYISRSIQRDLRSGDAIVFYRTKGDGPAHYTSVATTVGVIQGLVDGLRSAEDLIAACRKRSVFTDAELRSHWDYNPRNPPFVVDFLYVHSFPRRLNLAQLKDLRIIDEAPRGFEPISDERFITLWRESGTQPDIIVN